MSERISVKSLERDLHRMQEASVPTVQAGEDCARPDLIEKLSYHKHECDDLTLDEALDFLAQGWKKVHGRTERQLILQIVRLFASQPSNATTVPPVGVPSDAKIEEIWHALDGKSIIAGESSLNWNKAIRIAFARALLATTNTGKDACNHQFHYFGTEQTKRRCVKCDELEVSP